MSPQNYHTQMSNPTEVSPLSFSLNNIPHQANSVQTSLPFMSSPDLPYTKLTPSQESVVQNCIELLPYFKVLVIRGDSGSGKYTTAKEVFNRLDSVVENFDLCELAERTPRDLSNQHVVEYLNFLLSRLETRMTYDGTDPSCSRRKTPGIIYFRHYNRIADTLTDCYAKLRYLLPLILKTFVEKLPQDVRLVLTTHGCLLPEGIHWCVDLTTTRCDMEHIIDPYINHPSNGITSYEADQIMKMSKIVTPGRLLYCLRYALATRVGNLPNSQDVCDQPHIEKSFLDEYRKALSRFSGSSVNIERDVPEPVPEDDLIGVEDIIDEITTSIINPMRLTIPGIPIKKGLLLCGPPGTGKTSIGRWLAHKIKGKFYLIGGEAGISGSSLICTFDMMVKLARENAPAVIFIDDCDVLFYHDDTYRAFLTILDGIETHKRKDICLILTCMNLRKIPSSLLRGGRLEMALVTRLPDRHKIQIILQRSLNKMTQTITDYDEPLGLKVSNYVTLDFINSLSVKMIGWNCADIHRCVNDVSRLVVAGKGTNMSELFDKCIKQIREQYTLCGRCETTNLDDNPHQSYIS